MPEKDESALSQQDIDALLAGGAQVEDEASEDEPAVEGSDNGNDLLAGIDLSDDDSPDPEEDLDDDDEAAEEPEAVVEQLETGDDSTGTQASSLPVEQPTARESASPVPDIDGLTQRIDAIERSLQKIAALEKQVESLKKALNSKKEIEILRKKVATLESGARNTPVFNLYEKMTCSACGTHGAAQVKTRCPSCGKEGWFGRRTPAEGATAPAPPPAAQAKPRPRPEQKSMRKAA